MRDRKYYIALDDYEKRVIINRLTIYQSDRICMLQPCKWQ